MTNFWMAPLLNYIQAKKNVAKDIIFYANVLGQDNLTELGETRRREGRDKVRADAAELGGCYALLPGWYRKYLEKVGENPKEAIKGLIGLSNADKVELSMRFTKEAAQALRMRGTD